MKIELANNPCIVPIYGFEAKPETQPGYWAKFGAVPAAERLDYDTLTEFVDAAYDKAASADECSEASSHWRLASLLVDRAVHPATSDTLAEEDFEGAAEALDRVIEICKGAPLNRLTLRATQFSIDLPAQHARRRKEWLTNDEFQVANEKRGELLQEALELPEGRKMASMVAQLATRVLLERYPSGLQILTAGARERAEVGDYQDGIAADFYGWLRHDHEGDTVFAEKLPMKAYVDKRAVMGKLSLAPDSPVRRFGLGEHGRDLLPGKSSEAVALTTARWVCGETLGERLSGATTAALNELARRAQLYLVGTELDCCS